MKQMVGCFGPKTNGVAACMKEAPPPQCANEKTATNISEIRTSQPKILTLDSMNVDSDVGEEVRSWKIG